MAGVLPLNNTMYISCEVITRNVYVIYIRREPHNSLTINMCFPIFCKKRRQNWFFDINPHIFAVSKSKI